MGADSLSRPPTLARAGEDLRVGDPGGRAAAATPRSRIRSSLAGRGVAGASRHHPPVPSADAGGGIQQHGHSPQCRRRPQHPLSDAPRRRAVHPTHGLYRNGDGAVPSPQRRGKRCAWASRSVGRYSGSSAIQKQSSRGLLAVAPIPVPRTSSDQLESIQDDRVPRPRRTLVAPSTDIPW